jgi:hypothetical protein
MAFWQIEKSLHQHHQSRILRRSQGRLWVLRAIGLLKTSLKQIRQNRFFQYPECRKCVRMDFLQNETSIHVLPESRIFIRPQNIGVLRVILLLKTSLKRLHLSRFFRCSGCRNLVRMAFRHFETSLYRLHQGRFFKTSRRQIMRS